MKFLALAIGETFQWKGETYRKVGPVTASPIKGTGSRMIPRSAEIQPVANGVPQPSPQAESPEAALLRHYQNEIINLLEQWRESGIPDSAALNEMLTKLRKNILKSA